MRLELKSLRSSELIIYIIELVLGGPQLYQQKYGHPALRARHMPFAINQSMVDQWLICMEQAIIKVIKKPEHQGVIFQAISTLANNMRNR